MLKQSYVASMHDGQCRLAIKQAVVIIVCIGSCSLVAVFFFFFFGKMVFKVLRCDSSSIVVALELPEL